MDRFRATTTWQVLQIDSEPYLVMTFRGYGMVVASRELSTDQEYELLITGIKSLAGPLEELRNSNGGLFTGLRFGIKKESRDRSSPYAVDPKRTTTTVRNDDPHIDQSPKAASHEDRLWDRITKRYR